MQIDRCEREEFPLGFPNIAIRCDCSNLIKPVHCNDLTEHLFSGWRDAMMSTESRKEEGGSAQHEETSETNRIKTVVSSKSLLNIYPVCNDPKWLASTG